MGKNSGKDLVALGSALAATLAEGKTVEELNVLSALLNLMSDTVAVIAAKTELCEAQAQKNAGEGGANATNAT